MTTIVFFNQNFLTQREIISALRKLPNARTVVVDIAPTPTAEKAHRTAEIISELSGRVVVTVNEWGIDTEGILSEYFEKKRIVHINWSVDDPFYEEIMGVKKYRPSQLRFDFVSDKGYVEQMRKRGYTAFFLPLAADPDVFKPALSSTDKMKYEIVFVGNSYRTQIDDFLQKIPELIDIITPILPEVLNSFFNNVNYDIEKHLEEKLKTIGFPVGIQPEKALYIAKYTVGYFGRQRIIKLLAERYCGFKVFGDRGWLEYLPACCLDHVRYYDGLCNVYRSSKINIDINRMVIRNGFTQRVFDVPASGGFLITSAKPVIEEYFITSGPEREMEIFRSLTELQNLIDYYLKNDKERIAVARRGMKKVLSSHTYYHRIAEMFGTVSREMKLRL